MDKRKAAIGDFARLGASAFASGLAAAITLAVIALALAGVAQAASLNDAKTETLMFRAGTAGDFYLGEPIVVSGTRGNQPWSVALTSSREGDANGVGALWARARIASLMDEMKVSAPHSWSGDLPQTDTSAMLQLLLGLFALASAGIVAVIGRTVPARRDA